MLTLLQQYFPQLNDLQKARFSELEPLYRDWNAKINVISRQDIEHLAVHHVLHSLAIAKVFTFKEGAQILDLGTGGGFPGIPLAIFFPETQFVLMDGTGKKIRVVQEVSEALQLKNVQAIHGRAGEIKMPGRFDFVLSRGVAPLDQLMMWCRPMLSKQQRHAYPNGLIALKGGNLKAEIAALPGKGKDYTEIFPISQFFSEAFFEEKCVVYVQG